MVPSFLRFLQGYAVFENGDLPVAVAFVLGLLPICGAQDQIEQIARGGRLGVQIGPAGLFLCQGCLLPTDGKIKSSPRAAFYLWNFGNRFLKQWVQAGK